MKNEITIVHNFGTMPCDKQFIRSTADISLSGHMTSRFAYLMNPGS